MHYEHDTQFDIQNGAEPGATAQRPQLSRVVLAHAPRQPGSWLTWDVSQNQT